MSKPLLEYGKPFGELLTQNTMATKNSFSTRPTNVVMPEFFHTLKQAREYLEKTGYLAAISPIIVGRFIFGSFQVDLSANRIQANVLAEATLFRVEFFKSTKNTQTPLTLTQLDLWFKSFRPILRKVQEGEYHYEETLPILSMYTRKPDYVAIFGTSFSSRSQNQIRVISTNSVKQTHSL